MELLALCVAALALIVSLLAFYRSRSKPDLQALELNPSRKIERFQRSLNKQPKTSPPKCGSVMSATYV